MDVSVLYLQVRHTLLYTYLSFIAEHKGTSGGQAEGETKTKPSEEGSGEKSRPESTAKVSIAI